MAITKTENHIYQVNVTTDDGDRVLLNGTTKTKSTYYKVEEINGGINNVKCSTKSRIAITNLENSE